MKINRVGKSDRAKQIKKLDVLFSEYIRKRAMRDIGGCEYCKSPKCDIEESGKITPAWKQLQCSHFTGRTSLSVRYESDNACGVCGKCHMFLEHHPHDHDEFFLKRLGQERFDLLNIRSQYRGSKVDLVLTGFYLKEKLRELEGR